MDEPVPVLEPVLPRRPRRIGVAAIVLALVLVGVTALWGVFVLARPAATTASPLRLVVVETDGGVTTTDAFGTGRHAFDSAGLRYQFPAWSPDGTQVAAIGRRVDNVVTVDVFDADPAASGLPRRIYESADRPAFYLYWTPDGRHVTFLTTEPAPDGIALRIAPADASGPSQVVRAAAPLYWDFVDSSRLLLHTGSTGSAAFTGEVDLEGTSLENETIDSGVFRAPAVGGDGSSRAYVTAGEDPLEGGTMVVEARDGSVHHEIAVGGATAFGFDPTSTTLAFIAPDEPADPPAPIPSGPLRTVDARTGEVRTLLDAHVLAFFWSPDGQTLAALDLRPSEGPGPGEARAIGAVIGSGSISALPPLASTPGVGMHLSFVDANDGDIQSERDLRLSELFAFQLLPYFDQYALSHRFWAPDSSSIVLPLADEDGQDRVVVIPADGGDPHEIAAGWVGFWSP